MRIYFLTLTDADFQRNETEWVSDAIDVYNNNQFQNFSYIKSNYGTNLLGDSTWTGIDPEHDSRNVFGNETNVLFPSSHLFPPFFTNSLPTGNLQYLDTTAPVVARSFIITPHVSTTQFIDFTYDIFSSDDPDVQFPQEWFSNSYGSGLEDVSLNLTDRFIRCRINFNHAPDSFKVVIRLEFGKPVVGALFKSTRDMLDNFPQWMLMRESDLPATPALTTPQSIGAKLLNAVAGEWVEQLTDRVSFGDLQYFIDTVSLDQPAWIYKAQTAEIYPNIFIGDGKSLSHAYDLQELLEAGKNQLLCWWDEATNEIFTSDKYLVFTVNGIQTEQEAHHVWNNLDDLGVLVDLKRVYLESNFNFKARILDVYQNRPGVGLENFKATIRRELNLWKYFGATPNTGALGATPVVLEMADVEKDSTYTTNDWVPTTRFVDLVDYLSYQCPTTWGRFRWDLSQWDVGGTQGQGYSVLPFREDPTVSPGELTSGVGYGNDLYVYPPGKGISRRDFSAKLKVRGRQRHTRAEYPTAEVPIKIYGAADKRKYNNPLSTVWFTLELETFDVFQGATPYMAPPSAPAATPESGATPITSGNLLTTDQADFEGSVTDWTAVTNCSLSIASGAARTGTKTMYITSTADGDIVADTSAVYTPAVAGYMYSAFASLEATTISRVATLKLEYLDSSNGVLSVTTIGGSISTVDWSDFAVKAVAPPGTVKSKIVITYLNTTSGEVFKVDRAGIYYGAYDVYPIASVIPSDVSPVFYWSFQLSAKSDVSSSQVVPTSASYANYAYIGKDGQTLPEITWRTKTGDVPYTYGQISIDNIKRVKLRVGRWDFATQAYMEIPGNIFHAWFSHDPSTIVDYTQAVVPTIIGNLVDPTVFIPSAVVMSSSQIAYTVVRWRSEPFETTLKVNGLLPDISRQDTVFHVPYINWDIFLEAVPNKQVVLKLNYTHSSNYDIEDSTYDTAGTYDDLYSDTIGPAYAATTTSPGGFKLLLDRTYVFANGANDWDLNGEKSFPFTTTDITIAVHSELELVFPSLTLYPDVNTYLGGEPVNVDSIYPSLSYYYDLFEREQVTSITGTVDKNGPWRYGVAPKPGNTSLLLDNVNVSRADFGLSETEDYIITWIGVDSIDDPLVQVWTDSNTVQPAISNGLDVIYPVNSIQEIYDPVDKKYFFSRFTVKARLQENSLYEWKPNIHSGWFYDRDQEYYLYTELRELKATTNELILPSLAGQGAPIIVSNEHDAQRQVFRQVVFPASTPNYLINTETLIGTGTNSLFAAYEDIYDINVVDTTSNEIVSAGTSTNTNEILTTDVNVRLRTYTVSYKLRNSFRADHTYLDGNNMQHTVLYFDKSPAENRVSDYSVAYEGSIYTSATPLDIEINPLFSTIDEGFIYLSYDQFPLARVELSMSPNKIIADGLDYSIVTVRSLDSYGNPKPYQNFTVKTTFGILSTTSVVTDREGYASLVLTSIQDRFAIGGYVDVNGFISARVAFEVGQPTVVVPTLNLLAAPEEIPADGKSMTYIVGSVRDQNQRPLINQTVRWRKERSLYDLFSQALVYIPEGQYDGFNYDFDDYDDHEFAHEADPDFRYGYIATNANGQFTIGPITSQSGDTPGYWFISAETIPGPIPSALQPLNYATPNILFDSVGDIVFWNEYPDLAWGLRQGTEMLPVSVQSATPSYVVPPYATSFEYPVSYYDSKPIPHNAQINWLPPKWYAMNRYQQYQLGIMGATPNMLNDFLTHPPSRQ